MPASKAKNRTPKKKGSGLIRKALWGAALGIIFTLAIILLFALVLKTAQLDESVIKPVNQVIKILSILIASYATFRKCDEKPQLPCVLAGAFYIVGGFALFSAIEWTLHLSWALLSDLAMAVLIALISSVCFNLLLNRPRKSGKKARLSKSA